ncbi:MAG: GWxTD domain-containing protein [Chitinophagales bacterium]
MIRKPGICLLIVFSSLQAQAIEAVVSHAVFYLPDPARQNQLQPGVETYWQINPRTLHYITTPEKTIIARIKTDIIFMNDTGITREDHFVLETVPRHNVEELSTHSIIDLRRYFISPGATRMKFILTDMADSTHHFVYSDSFVVAPVTNTVFYSDLQLLDTILASPAQTVFNKNGHQQVPACTNFLDDKKNMLHYYAELYKTNEIPKSDYPLVQQVFITKKENEPFSKSFLKTDTITPQNISLVSGSFNIASLTSGNYYICVKLENNNHTIIASGSFFFQRLNTHPAKEDTAVKNTSVSDTGIENINVLNLNKTFLSKYSLAEIRAILKMLLPVSDALGTNTINGFLKKPDEIYMRYYIYNYFSNINQKDPGRAWKEFTAKVKEVNSLFTEHGTAGYETARGFIYLKYGAPTEIVTVENEQGSLPYEVWQYNNLTEMSHKEITNAVFLFYKPNQITSNYRLLHSTVSGEVQNTSWRTYLYTGSQGGNNINSRAEQYIGNR